MIIQTSVKTVKLYGYALTAAMVRSIAEEASVPVALHLDHCKEPDVIERCIEYGWSSVMFDGSTYPFEENLSMTKRVVEMAHAKDVSVEAELGATVGVEDDIHVKEQDSHLADYDLSMRMIAETGIDCFAPAIGTAHGFYKGEPKIAFELLERISNDSPVPIVIHGGTGLADEVFARVIALGGAKVNISTQLKHVFRDSLEGYFTGHPDDYEPVKSLGYLHDQVKAATFGFIDKFGSAGQAG